MYKAQSRVWHLGQKLPRHFSLCINDLPSNLYLVDGDAFSSNSVLSSCLPRLSRRRRRESRCNILAKKSDKRVVHVGRDFSFSILCDSRSSSYSGRSFWSKGFTFECNFYVRLLNFPKKLAHIARRVHQHRHTPQIGTATHRVGKRHIA